MFNRMIPGHPAGYIEALANLYNVIYDAYLYYQENKTLPNNPLLWTFEKEKLNFEFMKMLSHDA
ncbi:MAG: hypothetical protein RML10_09785 [Geminocystis sp.]|nr:hypothetical protein [Geminocystis sp.]